MNDNCEFPECTGGEYKQVITVPDIFADQKDGGGGGGGGGGEYTLPKATPTTLGGVKTNTANYGVTLNANGQMVLANATALDHDIENLTEVVEGIQVPNISEYIVTAPQLSQLLYAVTTDSTIVIRGGVMKKGEEDGANVPFYTLPGATTLKAGVMSADDKTKLDSLLEIKALDDTLSLSDEGELFVQNVLSWRPNTAYVEGEVILYDTKLYAVKQDFTSGETFSIQAPATANDDLVMIGGGADAAKRSANLPTNVFYNVSATDYNQDDITLHFVNKDLATGGDSAITLDLEAATAPYKDENDTQQPAHAGIMTATQATQLATLADAYQNATQGIELYSGSASVNYIDLNEDARHFDHLTIVGEYISEGSAAFHQSVTADFYPDGETNSFQLTATDIVANDVPLQITLQDIWQLDEDGLELALAAGFKSTVQGGASTTLTVTPETTSIFTITKVVGYGKKA